MIIYLIPFLLASGIYLQLFESGAGNYYLGIVLSHIIVGFGLIIFSGFMLIKKRQSFFTGNSPLYYGAILLIGLVAVTGVVIVKVGAVGIGLLFLNIHILSAVSAMIIGSIYLVTEAQKNEMALYLRSTFIMIILLIGGHIFRYSEPRENIGELVSADFLPSPGTTINGNYLSANDLNRSASCGTIGCHPNVYHQWSQSVHRFSSFNNPFYKKSVEYLTETAKPSTVRWCASCHDPVMLYTGLMISDVNQDIPEASAGVTCAVCHGMTVIPDITGNGKYIIGKPIEYPFSRSKSYLNILNKMLLRVKPGPHRAGMLKPFHKKGEFCGSCHKVSLDVEVNNYRWLRGQNEYDAWHNSGITGNLVSSFYELPEPMKCQQCHMYNVPSNDMGNYNNEISNHFFPGANTAIPAVIFPPDHKWISRTTEFLKDDRLTVDIFGVIKNGELNAPLGECFSVIPGSEVLFEIVVRTRRIGHEFPGGTIDSNEPWIEVKGTDGMGDIVFSSGYLDSAGHVDPAAHFFNGALLDKHGNFIAKRNPHEWVTTLYKHSIPPGSAEVVHYRWMVPDDYSGMVTIEAQVNYRKFNRGFTKFSLNELTQRLPIVNMAYDTLILSVTNESVLECPQDLGGASRFNDYGIGLLRQKNLEGARKAFDEVTHRDPAYVNGYINIARVLIKEGKFEESLVQLVEAEKRQPGYEKIIYFRGLIEKIEGNYEAASSLFEQVKLVYTKDRNLLKTLGQTYYFMKKYNKSLAVFNEAMNIDPEDAEVHYNLMLLYKAVGEKELAQKHKESFLKYKQDEEARSISQKARIKFPYANNEAQLVHHHEL